ncbi:CIA30 family protein [Shewanella waksmanii]|uniref:CIA30 family protein n=1 Tax=Shewanella waksmanii TaxID=213783 RepID=UPI003735D6AC
MINIGQWQIINDTVMGGVSRSQVDTVNRQLHFSGTVSIANNGGFASIKAPISISPVNSTPAVLNPNKPTIKITVKGDGNCYQLRLQTCESIYDSPKNYQSYFTTAANQWQHFYFSHEQFVESYRGQVFPQRPHPNLAALSHIGFLIANQRNQDFHLIIGNIELIDANQTLN